MKGTKALVELLTEAFRADLPALDWRIGTGTGSSLYATANGPMLDPAARRAAFDRWSRHPGAVVWPETTDPASATRLRANADNHLGVHVTIAADLYE